MSIPGSSLVEDLKMLVYVCGCNCCLLKSPTFWGSDSPTGSTVPKATLIVNSLSVYMMLYQNNLMLFQVMAWGWSSAVPLLLTWAQVHGECGRWKHLSTTALIKESPFCLSNGCICPVKGMGVDLAMFSLLLHPYSSLPMCSSSCPLGWWESLQVNIDYLFEIIQKKDSTSLFTCMVSLLLSRLVPEEYP